MLIMEQYRSAFMAHLEQKNRIKEPANLYEPISYILNLGGKQLRPILTLMSADIFEADYTTALDAAMAVEVFHNYYFVHDYIMDETQMRREKQTVHKKWDLHTGILSGDAMLIYSYQLLESYPDPIYKQLMQLFGQSAIAVCEGQQ